MCVTVCESQKSPLLSFRILHKYVQYKKGSTDTDLNFAVIFLGISCCSSLGSVTILRAKKKNKGLVRLVRAGSEVKV